MSTLRHLEAPILRLITGFTLVALAAPLLLSRWFINIDFLQAGGFQIAVEILLALWVLLFLINRSYRPNWRSPIVIALLVFTAFLAIATIWSRDPWLSFWSVRSRMTGAVFYLHLTTFFLILISCFKTREAWRRLLIANVIIAALMSFMGIFNHDAATWGWRLSGTIKNPGFFGLYVLPNLCLVGFLGVTATNRAAKITYAILGAYLAVFLYLSGSRAGIAAAIVAALIMLAYLVASKWPMRRVIASGLALIVIGSAMLSAAIYLRTPEMSSWGREHLPRIVSRFVYSDPGYDRLALWSIALSATAERPLTGWGWGNFGEGYEKYFNPDSLGSALTQEATNRVHNRFLESFVTLGWPGFILDIALWAVLFVMLIRTARRTSDETRRRGLVALAAGLFAYLLSMMVFVEGPTTLITVYLLFALAAMETGGVVEAVSQPIETKRERRERKASGADFGSLWRWLVAALIVGSMTTALLAYINIIPFWQTLTAQSFASDINAGRPAEALATLNRVLVPGSYLNNEIINTAELFWGRFALVRSAVPHGYETLAREMIRLNLSEAEYHPNLFWLRSSAIEALTVAGDLDLSARRLAEKEAAAVSDEFRGRSYIYSTLAILSMFDKNWPQAIVSSKWELSTLTANDLPTTRAAVHYRLARAYAGNGDFALAKSELDQSAKYGTPIGENARVLLDMAPTAWEQGTIEPWMKEHADIVGERFKANAEVVEAHATIAILASDRELVDTLIARLREMKADEAADRVVEKLRVNR